MEADYKDGQIHLMQGDCLERMGEIESGSVDMVLTDIPYGEVNRNSNGLRNLDKKNADTWEMNFSEVFSELDRICNGSFYIFCGTEQVSEIRAEMVERGLTTRLCIWEKTNPSPMNGQHVWVSGIECCVFGKKKKAVFNEHCKNTVWRFPSTRGKLHPTMKPLKMFDYLVSVSSNEGGTVFDPFMGSGTAGVSCKNLNRNFIGVELDEGYFQTAKERILNHGDS